MTGRTGIGPQEIRAMRRARRLQPWMGMRRLPAPVVWAPIFIVRGKEGKEEGGEGSSSRVRQTLVAAATAAGVAGALGALVMYVFDPDRGRSRRTRASSHVRGLVRRRMRRASRTVARRAHFAEGRARGAVHTVRHLAPARSRDLDDVTLSDKVRSEVLGRHPFSRYGLHVDCVDGVVHLRGEMSSDRELARLVRAVRRVDGVERVESYVHHPGEVAPNKADVAGRWRTG